MRQTCEDDKNGISATDAPRFNTFTKDQDATYGDNLLI